jgi:hypothetical protein
MPDSPDKSRQGLRDRRTPEGLRLLDWTSPDATPATADIPRASSRREGMARLAVVIDTPRLLGAASVFAEQAGLQGTQVRVFINEEEALTWLYNGPQR